MVAREGQFTVEDTRRRVVGSIEKGLEREKGWPVYDLHKTGIIDGEEAREILGAFEIENRRKSEDPSEDKVLKIQTLEDVEIPYYEEKIRKAREEGKGERAAALKEVKDWCE